LGAALTGAAVLIAAWWGAGTGPALAVVLAAAAALGCGLAYGLDPRQDKGLAPELARKAGLRTEQVIEAITEAEAKLREIEQTAAGLHNRELTERLARIVAQARAVLAQIEQDPADLRRARRFMVTYLDGTRDVVQKYTRQQQDLADTELQASFRHVLETVERVFGEQEEVLKRNETMDLEVQIEVLRTQLEREGVA
jgi:5-bromo-4-chloroindolyl phosphate hydrolysis protein